jgi:hypothetical protein
MFQRRFAMVLTGRLRRYLIFAVPLTVLSFLSNAKAKPRIMPLRATATFASHSSESRWSVPVKSTDGSTVYDL